MFYILTNTDADRFKIVTRDIADPDGDFVDLIPEQKNITNNAWLVGGVLLT